MSTVETDLRTLACPHCTKTYSDPNDLWQHAKAKHGKKAAAALRPVVEREPSMGELVAEAQLARAMGEFVDPWIEEMFGDYL